MLTWLLENSPHHCDTLPIAAPGHPFLHTGRVLCGEKCSQVAAILGSGPNAWW